MELYFIVQWKGLIKGTNKIYSIERFSVKIQQTNNGIFPFISRLSDEIPQKN
jgi:hypothetical protein